MSRSTDVADHAEVGAGGGDLEFFRDDGPAGVLVEGDGWGPGVTPEGADRGRADEGFGGGKESVPTPRRCMAGVMAMPRSW